MKRCGHGNRLQLTGSVEDVQRTGRPCSAGAQDDRYLRLLSRRNRGLSAPDLNAAFEEATDCQQNGRRRLHDANLHS